MTNNQLQLVRELTEILPNLTSGQLHWIGKVVSVFSGEHTFETRTSDLFVEKLLRNFGKSMRVHYSFYAEPFSKDK